MKGSLSNFKVYPPPGRLWLPIVRIEGEAYPDCHRSMLRDNAACCFEREKKPLLS